MEQQYRKAKVTYIVRNEKKISKKKVNLPTRLRINIDYKKISLYVIPIFLFGTGVSIIGSQLFPSAKFLVEQRFSPKYFEVLSPLPEETTSTMSDNSVRGKFESQYFSKLFNRLREIDSTKVAGAKIPYKADWEGQFYMTIPSINIKDMPVTANVNSYDEEIYNKELQTSLAHFKGTDLPTPPSYDSDSNTFIYGHSAPSSWATFHKSSFEAAFNPLFDLNIGDEIFITFDEEEFKYTIRKIKVTKPEDLSTLAGIPGQKTLTLMTCAPPGSTSNRLNVIATLTE